MHEKIDPLGFLAYPNLTPRKTGLQGQRNKFRRAAVVQIPGSKPVHPDLVAEALRVVNAMPAWKPGLKDGKVVKTRYTLPVKFTLDK